MIRYVIKKNNELDFTSPLDAENPFSFNLDLLTPSTELFLVNYTETNGNYDVKSCLNKPTLTVLKTIVNLYPNLLFSLNLDFWKDDLSRTELLKTCLRTLNKRNEINKNNDVENFKSKYIKFLEENNIGDTNEIKLVP